MTTPAELFAKKKFPEWFSEHDIFKKIDRIKKVFPGIGLPNSVEEVEINNVNPVVESAKNLLHNLRANLLRRNESLLQFIKERPEMSLDRKTNGFIAHCLMNSVISTLTKQDSIIHFQNGKIVLRMSKDILGHDGKVFAKGESIFRIYNKISKFLQENKFAKLIDFERDIWFKTFSKENLPNAKYKVVFSSNGIDGAWDIATMSMRGIASCQNWDNGEYKLCTIGSVIDPFVGIIYLTSGVKANQYGSRMISRCIVRFIVSKVNKKPYLFLDFMYPGHDNNIIKVFENFIKSKTNVELINYIKMNNLNGFYLPLTKTRILLKEEAEDPTMLCRDTVSSYQDTKIQDQEIINHKKIDFDEEKNYFCKSLNKYISESIESLSVENFNDNISNVIFSLNKKGNSILPVISKMISNSFVKIIDIKDFENPQTLQRRLHYNYFNYKRKHVNDLKRKITRDINGYFRLKNKQRISDDNFAEIMNALYPHIDKQMKKSLKTFIEK